MNNYIKKISSNFDEGKLKDLDSFAGDLLGGATSLFGGVAGIANSVGGLAEGVDTSKYDYRLMQLDGASRRSGFRNNETLLNDRLSGPSAMYADDKDFERSDMEAAAGIGSSLLQGAKTGLELGGRWGALVGGVAGLGAGIGGLAYGNSMRRAQKGNINNSMKLASLDADRQFEYNTDSVNEYMNRQMNANIAAEGGKINTGSMGMYDTHGAHFSPGLIRIDAGGTHESNPYGGVQIGVDANGTPNLVEEGETVFGDFVFSDRIKPSRKLLRDNNLPEKFYGKSYSEIAKKLSEEADDRPNDTVSQNGLKAMLERLSTSQESQKEAREQRRLERELNSMSPEELLAMGNQIAEMNRAAAQQQMMPQDEMMPLIGGEQYALGGNIFDKGGRKKLKKQDLSLKPSDSSVDQSLYNGPEKPVRDFSMVPGLDPAIVIDTLRRNYSFNPDVDVITGDDGNPVFVDVDGNPINITTNYSDSTSGLGSGIEISKNGAGVYLGEDPYLNLIEPAVVVAEANHRYTGPSKPVNPNTLSTPKTKELNVSGRFGNISLESDRPANESVVPVSSKSKSFIVNSAPQKRRVIATPEIPTVLSDRDISEIAALGLNSVNGPLENPGLSLAPSLLEKPSGTEPELASIRPFSEMRDVPGTEDNAGNGSLPTFMMYSGPAMAAISSLYNALRPADRTIENSYRSAIRNDYVPVDHRSAYVDPRYDPLPVNMAQDAILADAAASRRAAMNSGMGPSIMPTVAAMNYQAGQNIGNAHMQNRLNNTSMYNQHVQAHNQNEDRRMQGVMQAIYHNNMMRNQNAARNLQLLAMANQARDAEDTARANAISQSLSLAESGLSGIGRQNAAINMINSNPANLGYGIGSGFNIGYNPYGLDANDRKCGGKIKRKK